MFKYPSIFSSYLSTWHFNSIPGRQNLNMIKYIYGVSLVSFGCSLIKAETITILMYLCPQMKHNEKPEFSACPQSLKATKRAKVGGFDHWVKCKWLSRALNDKRSAVTSIAEFNWWKAEILWTKNE